MTRKHFQAIADALALTKPEIVEGPTKQTSIAFMAQWRHDVQAIAIAIGHFNPQFDKEKFLEACGFEDYTKGRKING